MSDCFREPAHSLRATRAPLTARRAGAFVAWLSLAPLALPAHAQTTESADWAAVIDKASKAVVSIRVDAVRAFDTGGAGNSVATGFVIDKERGLILTNRHVVHPGPVRAEAVFLDNEEVELQAIYRDPVHDFGIYRFNPADVRFMALEELQLDPLGAAVGAEVRIIGNDAGEKISILPGTLARLDRAAPEYGVGYYNDFNTFYIQSASSTSGGSSGSPVIDRRGRVIALNAGAKKTSASSFFLPLDRIVRAVDLLRAGQPVTRGTLQTTFVHQPYDELKRLGLSPETEKRMRAAFPQGTGLLVVDDLLGGGPADGILRPGDVLLAVNQQAIDTFVPLEESLDAHVQQEIQVTLSRGGVESTVTMTVADLHAITPDRFVSVGGGVLHDLSYQIARGYGLPLGGVYVAYRGYTFGNGGVPGGAVITEVAGQAVSDVEAFAAVLAELPDGLPVPVRWWAVNDANRDQLSIVEIDRRWFSTEICRRDDTHGTWPCDPIPAPEGRVVPPPRAASLPPVSGRVGKAVAPSLVTVDFHVPYRVDGVHGGDFRGTGLVVDAEEGLVLVDRDTVPITLGDVRVIVGGSVEIPASVVWLHPAHNLALVRFDPKLLVDSPLRTATFAKKPLEKGSSVIHVGLGRDHDIVTQPTTVESIDTLYLPLPRTPFFREVNGRVITPSSAASSTGGVLVDKRGRVQAMWGSFVDLSDKEPAAFFAGIPAETIQAALDAYHTRPDAPWGTLGAELGTVELSFARQLGLSPARTAEVEGRPGARQVLVVGRTVRGSPADQVLQSGDLVLSRNGEAVWEPWQVEESMRDGRPLSLTILRGGAEQTVEVAPNFLPTSGTDRVLLWSGAVLQDVPTWLPAQRGAEAVGVYVSYYWYGTPAGRYGLRATWRITAVNDAPVANLNDFLAALGDDPQSSVRLTYVDLQGREKVLTLEPNLAAWPTEELRRDSKTGEWSRTRIHPQ